MRRPSEIFIDPSHDEWAEYVLFKMNSDMPSGVGMGYSREEVMAYVGENKEIIDRALTDLGQQRKINKKRFLHEGYRYAPWHYRIVDANLTQNQELVFRAIEKLLPEGAGGLSFGEISKASGAKQGSVSVITETLENKGWIKIKNSLINNGWGKAGVTKNHYTIRDRSKWNVGRLEGLS